VTSDPIGPAPIRTADLDHVLPWDEGAEPTPPLTALSRPAHNLKTSKQLAVTRTRDGTATGPRLAPASRSPAPGPAEASTGHGERGPRSPASPTWPTSSPSHPAAHLTAERGAEVEG
jgi:hypothetical protein